jgi:hypothetical protein
MRTARCLDEECCAGYSGGGFDSFTGKLRASNQALLTDDPGVAHGGLYFGRHCG